MAFALILGQASAAVEPLERWDAYCRFLGAPYHRVQPLINNGEVLSHQKTADRPPLLTPDSATIGVVIGTNALARRTFLPLSSPRGELSHHALAFPRSVISPWPDFHPQCITPCQYKGCCVVNLPMAAKWFTCAVM